MTTVLGPARRSHHPPAGPTSRLPARVAAGVASGLLVDAAFAPVGWWVLAPVGVAVLVLALRGASARAGALVGLAHGLGFFLPLLHWSGTFVGTLPWVALAVLEALFLLGLGAGATLVLRLPGWPVWFAALWVLEEAARARLPFGGFGWGRLAFSQADAPAVGLAALGGAPLVSFVVALAGALLAAAVRARVLTAVLLAGLAVGVAGCGLAVPRPVDGTSAVVALVQGNVPELGLDFNAQRAAVLRNHVEVTQALAADVAAGSVPAPALVVWPENASDIDPLREEAAAALIDEAAGAVGVPILVGAVLQGADGPRNASIVWSPETGPGAQYVKRHPAPFGEYIPLRSFVRLFNDNVDRVPRDFVAGRSIAALRVGPAEVAPVICFEVIDDDLVRSAVLAGGTLLTVQTNNATFGRSAESAQQLAMSRLRAVEHGRTVLSASTTGISAIIAPDGAVLASTEVFTADTLVGSVPLRTATTPADRVGAWPELVLAGLGLGALLTGAASRLAARRRASAGWRR